MPYEFYKVLHLLAILALFTSMGGLAMVAIRGGSDEEKKKARKPLMIIHGSRDEVVLYSDTIAVVNRLIAREQPFELVTLPGAGQTRQRVRDMRVPTGLLR